MIHANRNIRLHRLIETNTMGHALLRDVVCSLGLQKTVVNVDWHANDLSLIVSDTYALNWQKYITHKIGQTKLI